LWWITFRIHLTYFCMTITNVPSLIKPLMSICQWTLFFPFHHLRTFWTVIAVSEVNAYPVPSTTSIYVQHQILTADMYSTYVVVRIELKQMFEHCIWKLFLYNAIILMHLPIRSKIFFEVHFPIESKLKL